MKLGDKKPKKILVFNALPYANNAIHIGTLVGYIQADIWVRFQRLQGLECLYLCASDAHASRGSIPLACRVRLSPTPLRSAT